MRLAFGMSTGYHSVFNTNTEIVAVWVLFLMAGSLIFVLHYLTVVRVPPRPILDKFFAVITVPSSIQKKLESGWEYMRAKGNSYAGKIRSLNKEIEMKSLTTSSVTETARSTSEDMATAIIGVPLEDDEEETEIGSIEKKQQQAGSVLVEL